MAANRLHLVQADAVPAQPWRNGGGATRTLFTWPAAAAGARAGTTPTAPTPPTASAAGAAASDDWQLRLSLADIGADGPFSAFPGVTRWFAVVEGPGVALSAPGLEALLTPDSPPLAFDGALAPMARLRGGATRDLNLMLRGLAGGLWPARPGAAWVPPQRWAGLFCATPVRWQLGALPPRDLPGFTLVHGWPDAAVPWRILPAAADAAAAPPPRAWWLSADLSPIDR